MKGIREAGGDATLFQVPETLSDEVLAKMYAPPKPTDIAVLNDPAELEAFDGVLFGIPTRKLIHYINCSITGRPDERRLI